MARTVVFVLPIKTKRAIVDSCWSFNSSNTISNFIETKLVDFLNLDFEEEYLDIKKYKNEYTEMNVVFTNKKIIEIDIRTKLEKEKFVKVVSNLLRDDEVEVFTPD